jgi:hypothetical protein
MLKDTEPAGLIWLAFAALGEPVRSQVAQGLAEDHSHTLAAIGRALARLPVLGQLDISAALHHEHHFGDLPALAGTLGKSEPWATVAACMRDYPAAADAEFAALEAGLLS